MLRLFDLISYGPEGLTVRSGLQLQLLQGKEDHKLIRTPGMCPGNGLQ